VFTELHRQRIAKAARARWASNPKVRILTCSLCGRVQRGPETGNRRKYCSRECSDRDPARRQIISLKAKTRVRHGKWKDLPIEDAKCLFEGWVASKLPMYAFLQNMKAGHQLAEAFQRFFPTEYEHQTELAQERLSKRYGHGASFEYRVRNYYKKLGYFVLRSPHSSGFADLVAIRQGEVLLIQCKMAGKLRRREKEGLFRLARSIGAKPLMVAKERPSNALIIKEVKEPRPSLQQVDGESRTSL
jgi:Holliday junction resolvase